MEHSLRPHDSSLSSEIHMSFPSNLQHPDRAPSHTVATTSAEVGLIPGIENGPKEALTFGLMGALALGAAGGIALLRNRNSRPSSPAPGFIPSDTPSKNPGADAFNRKRDAAARYGANPYTDPQAYVQGFIGSQMTRKLDGHRIPDPPYVPAPGEAPKDTHGQSTSTYRVGTAPRERMYYQDRRQRAREAQDRNRHDPNNTDPLGMPEPNSPGVWNRNKNVRRFRKGQAILGRERNGIHSDVDRFGDVILDKGRQEQYISHFGITGQERRAMRRAGRRTRRTAARNQRTQDRMNR